MDGDSGTVGFMALFQRDFSARSSESGHRLHANVGAFLWSALPGPYAIAEFMLNLLPIPDPPTRHDLGEYVRANFERADASLRFSCDQDFIQIRRSD